MNLLSEFSDISAIAQRWNYPGGEVGSRLLTPGKNYNPKIRCRIQSSNDLMFLLLTLSSLKAQDNIPITLYIPYLPYARQDRIVTPGDQVALEVLLRLITSIGNVSNIISHDIHSSYAFDIAEELGIILENIPQKDYFPIRKLEQEFDKDSVILICPDNGAKLKTFELESYIDDYVYDILFANKVRDQHTGHLTSMEFLNELKDIKPNTNWFIVDDIYYGGGTFLMLADLLRRTYGARAHLFVTHGIFSKGLEDLCKNFISVGSTDSFLQHNINPANFINYYTVPTP